MAAVRAVDRPPFTYASKLFPIFEWFLNFLEIPVKTLKKRTKCSILLLEYAGAYNRIDM